MQRMRLFLKLGKYLAAVAGVALTTAAIHLIPGAEHVTNVSLLYLLVVMGSAYQLGRGPAVVASLLAVLSFNWFFVEPRYTFAVKSPADWLALGIFLLTAFVINRLTHTLQLRAEEARQRERETAALSQASWAVTSQVSHQRTLTEVLEQMTSVIPSEVAAIVVRSPAGVIEVVASHADHSRALPDLSVGAELRAVDAVLKGDATRVRPEATDDLSSPCYLPLIIEQQILGVLFLRKSRNQPFLPREKRMMESLANHAAVTLERQRLSQAQTQAQAVLEADKLKTALLSMVSHDFRSPLAAIKASVTGLLQDDLPWDAAIQHELLSGINLETDRLNRMVGDILALSRLEADAWRPQREWVLVDEVVGAALDAFNAQENARIAVQLDGKLPEVSLDSVQIVQVLTNLLENALKYSPPDSPVELRVFVRDEQLMMEIWDRGYGLPAGEEERIFERFYRASRWRESALPGSGIGLSICRGLVEAHGGRLTAANGDGGGAVFRLILPMSD